MKTIEKTEESLYSIMKSMGAETKLIVPIENWGLVRAYASQLNKAFGAVFSIKRMKTNRSKYNFILIELRN